MIKQVILSEAHSQKWLESRAALLISQPFYAHLFLSLLTKQGVNGQMAVFTDDPSIPVAATDGACIILRPDVFFEFPIKERVFILAHEIQHCVFNHMWLMLQWKRQGYIAYSDGVKLDLYPMLTNAAADYIINDMLIECGVGAMPQKDGEQYGLWDKNVATWEDQTADVYRKLYEKNPPPKGGKGGAGRGKGEGDDPSGCGGFDAHLEPGTVSGDAPGVDEGEISDRAWATEIAQAAAVARAQGRMPGALERLIGEILNPRVDWTQQIQAFFARAAGGGGYDWRKADRRLITRRPKPIFAPRRSGNGAGPIAVAVDTSGSITDEIIAMFLGEISGILAGVRPTVIYVVWCDAQIHRVDTIKDVSELHELRKKGAPGGGGTSFRPVFEWAEDKELDALVYLTDGYGSFPEHEPTEYQLLWGSISPGHKYPFGKVVDIPLHG